MFSPLFQRRLHRADLYKTMLCSHFQKDSRPGYFLRPRLPHPPGFGRFYPAASWEPAVCFPSWVSLASSISIFLRWFDQWQLHSLSGHRIPSIPLGCWKSSAPAALMARPATSLMGRPICVPWGSCSDECSASPTDFRWRWLGKFIASICSVSNPIFFFINIQPLFEFPFFVFHIMFSAQMRSVYLFASRFMMFSIVLPKKAPGFAKPFCCWNRSCCILGVRTIYTP